MSEISFRIETTRLILRPFELRDVPDVHPLYAERWPHWPAPLSTSLERTRERVERHMAIQAEHGFSIWLARDRATGAVVGDCGLQPLERRGPEVELGYRLGRRYWGRGLATEAAEACLQVAFDELALEEIVAVTHPDNIGSRRVMEKLGMTYRGTGRYYGECVTYALSRPAASRLAWAGALASGAARPSTGGRSAPRQDAVDEVVRRLGART